MRKLDEGMKRTGEKDSFSKEKRNMIIVKILGGFASQLGKYLWAKLVAEDMQRELVLDISEYYDGYFRPFMLHWLNIENCKVINGIESMGKITPVNNGHEMISAYANSSPNIYIHKEEQDYYDFFNKYPKFIISSKTTELTSLSPKFVSPVLNVFEEKIKAQYSVAVHIRRGDFVSLGWDDGIEDYIAAIGYVYQNHPDAHFYFFSNDICWVKKRFGKNEVFTFVEKNDNFSNQDIDEFFCMSLCDLRILSSHSGFCKLANYVSVANHNSEGAILAQNSEREASKNESLFRDESIYELSEIENKKGRDFFFKHFGEISETYDTLLEKSISSQEGEVIVLSFEKYDRWKIRGDYRLAYNLSKKKINVLYVNLNVTNRINANTLLEATDMDGKFLGFRAIFGNSINQVSQIIYGKSVISRYFLGNRKNYIFIHDENFDFMLREIIKNWGLYFRLLGVMTCGRKRTIRCNSRYICKIDTLYDLCLDDDLATISNGFMERVINEILDLC